MTLNTDTGGRGRHRPPLDMVASVYLSALDVPRFPAPLRAVATKFSVSTPTASRYIRAARDAGLLPAVVDGERPRGTDVCPTWKGPYKRFNVQAFWSAALAEHRRRKHKTFGWHNCTAPSCVARQREFDATEG